MQAFRGARLCRACSCPLCTAAFVSLSARRARWALHASARCRASAPLSPHLAFSRALALARSALPTLTTLSLNMVAYPEFGYTETNCTVSKAAYPEFGYTETNCTIA